MTRNIILAAITMLVFTLGCGEAPVEQAEGAKDALQRAQVADAETYAPDVYKAAADTLNAAMAAKQQTDSKFKLLRNYGETERLLARAEEIANQASAKAESEKERIRLEVGDLLQTAAAVIDSAETAIKKAPQGKGSRADIELMKSDLAAAKATHAEAQSDFDQGNFVTAKAKLEAAVTKARALIQEIKAAAARKSKP